MSIYARLILIVGICLVAGLGGGYCCRRLRIPSTAGYILVGLLLGAGFKFFHEYDIEMLQVFSPVVLGILGFMGGSSLRFGYIRKHGRRLADMVLCLGIITFIITGGTVYLLLSHILHDKVIAGAMACLLGALACGIGPWTTCKVMNDARARGTVSAALKSITELSLLPLMIMYVIGVICSMFISQGISGEVFGKLVVLLGGAMLLGVFFAVVLLLAMRITSMPSHSAAMILAFILILSGMTAPSEIDTVVATFVMGAVMVNLSSRISDEATRMLWDFHLPVYVVFLVVVSAQLELESIPNYFWWLTLAVIISGCIGKMLGVWFGGVFYEKSAHIRKYLSLCLNCQSAFIISLAIGAMPYLAGHREAAVAMVFTAVMSTLAWQVLGPFIAFGALKKAGEIGRNLSDDDLMMEMTVNDVYVKGCATVMENEPLPNILVRFTEAEQLNYPVLTRDGELAGLLSFNALRGVMADRDSWEWLVAADLMEPAGIRVMTSDPLVKAKKLLEEKSIPIIPVMDSDNDYRFAGIIDLATIQRKVHSKLLIKTHPGNHTIKG